MHNWTMPDVYGESGKRGLENNLSGLRRLPLYEDGVDLWGRVPWELVLLSRRDGITMLIAIVSKSYLEEDDLEFYISIS